MQFRTMLANRYRNNELAAAVRNCDMGLGGRCTCPEVASGVRTQVAQIMRNVLLQRKVARVFARASMRKPFILVFGALALMACSEVQGPQGEQGEQGPQGPRGKPGLSLPAPTPERYEVRVEAQSAPETQAFAPCEEGDTYVSGSCQFGKLPGVPVSSPFYIGEDSNGQLCIAVSEEPLFTVARAICEAQ